MQVAYFMERFSVRVKQRFFGRMATYPLAVQEKRFLARWRSL